MDIYTKSTEIFTKNIEFLAGNQLYELLCHRIGWCGCCQKKTIAIFGYKQWLLSLDMKTKIVQHVSRINLSHFKFQILNLNF